MSEKQIEEFCLEFARNSEYSGLEEKLIDMFQEKKPEYESVGGVLRPKDDKEALKDLYELSIEKQMELFKEYPYKQYLIREIISQKDYPSAKKELWAEFIFMQIAERLPVLVEILNNEGKDLAEIIRIASRDH